MTSDAPEFRTKSSTPVSPVPFHPPESFDIPVLRNQIDPLFNMTSTHIEAVGSSTSPALIPTLDQAADVGITVDNELDASFSDPYDDEDKMVDEDTSKNAAESAEVDDDYAKTFDSDGEESTNRQDVSNENIDQKIQPPSVPVSVLADDNSSLLNNLASNSTIAPPDGRDNPYPHMPFPTTATTTGDIPEAVGSNAPSLEIETLQSHPQFNPYEAVSSGEIDIQQILDDITANAALNATNSTSATPTSANPSTQSFSPSALGLPAHASLPPRPQVAQNQPMHPAYPTQGDIRKYHAGPPNFPPPPTSSYRPLGAGASASIVAAGAPGTSTDPRNVLPPPPSASFHSVSAGQPPTMSYSQQTDQRLPAKDVPASSIETPGLADDFEMSWTPAVQKLYDEFLADERMYVSEGLWDRFPAGSRLFIGNLPSEQVTKRDLFHAFYRYGRLAQVSIKQAYGFVQFHDVAACQRALKGQQGQEIRGRKMHLEISKPQKNTRNAAAVAHAPPITTRRSRSPDYMRGGIDRAIRGSQALRGDGYDRYDARAGVSPRDSEFRGPLRTRDDYRPGRSPSPPRGSYRSREDYAPARGYDYHDGRERRRSRSRSPYGRRENGRYRERSMSPKPRTVDDDNDLQIPRRDPREVPDAQIILMDDLDRGFVAWVEGEMRARGIRTEVMLLSPRTSLPAVIRRQILEGVLAVAQLTRRAQDTSKIPLQVFDRTGGVNNVRFDEYQDLEPKIAAELVLRAKQTQVPPASASYVQPQLLPQQTYQPSTPASVAPNLTNIVGQLDNATLQKLLGTLNSVAPSPQVTHQTHQTHPPLDLAGILGGLVQQQQPPLQHNAYQQQAQPSTPYTSLPSNESLASLLGNMTPQTQPQGQSAQQVQNIMAQLAKFRQ